VNLTKDYIKKQEHRLNRNLSKDHENQNPSLPTWYTTLM